MYSNKVQGLFTGIRLLIWIVGDPENWNNAFIVCAAAFFLAGISALGIDATIPIAPIEDDGPMPECTRRQSRAHITMAQHLVADMRSGCDVSVSATNARGKRVALPTPPQNQRMKLA